MEEKQEEKVEKKITEQLCEKVEEQLKKIVEQGVTSSNIDYTYKLVDIHKDLANENYWKVKEEKYMREYREGYGEYNEGYGEGYGRRYRGEYGRRGVKGTGRGRYRGEDPMEEMKENYEEYNEASEYGAEGGMAKSADGIMKNLQQIVKELSETGSPQVMQIIKKNLKKTMEELE